MTEGSGVSGVRKGLSVGGSLAQIFTGVKQQAFRGCYPAKIGDFIFIYSRDIEP